MFLVDFKRIVALTRPAFALSVVKINILKTIFSSTKNIITSAFSLQTFFPQAKRLLPIFLGLFFLSIFLSDSAFAGVCSGGAQCVSDSKNACNAIAGCTWAEDVHQQDDTPFTSTICNMLGVATGKGGKVFAGVAVISLGVGFFMGKVSWGLILGVASGVATLFGSATIITAVSGGSVVDCIEKVRSGCDINSPGFETIPSNSTPSGTQASHNASVTIKCNTDYIGTISNLSCIDGKWYGASGFCKEAACKDINTKKPLANGIWSPNSAVEGATIYGTCNNGFYGSPSIKCSAGDLQAITGECKPLPTCDQTTPGYKTITGKWIITATQAEMTGTVKAFVGQSVKATCDIPDATHSAGVAPPNMNCAFDPTDHDKGIWSITNPPNPFPTCKLNLKCNDSAINTTPATTITYGAWPLTTAPNHLVEHATLLTAVCDSGNVSPMPQLLCNDGNWSKTNNAQCPQGCTNANGALNLGASGSWPAQTANHNTSLTATCLFGANTVPMLNCQNGVWTANGGVCKQGCSTAATDLKINGTGSTITVANGTWPATPAIVAHNGVFAASCNKGVPDAIDIPELRCNDGKWSWSSTKQSCPSNCTTSSPGYKTLGLGGSWNLTTANHNTYITGNCGANGYTVAGVQPKLICYDGTWTDDNTSNCIANCAYANRPVISNVTWPGTGDTNNGVTINGTCNSGYSGAPTANCNSGNWTVGGTACSPSPCTFASSSNNINWGTTTLANGGTITGTCNSGFKANGPANPTLTCNLGTATITGSCVALANCTSSSSNFPSIANATWSATSANHNASITLNGCSDGKIRTGSSFNITCNDGNWITTGFNGGCITPAPCTSSSPGYVNDPNIQWSNSGNANSGSQITSSCKQGYAISGTVGPLTCNNGVYSGVTSGSCLMQCTTNPNTSNPITYGGGTWNFSGAVNSGITIAATCPSGSNSPAPTITCNNGVWTANNIGNCKPRNCPGSTTFPNFPVCPTNSSKCGTWAYGGTAYHTYTIHFACNNVSRRTAEWTCCDGSFYNVSCSPTPSSANKILEPGNAGTFCN